MAAILPSVKIDDDSMLAEYFMSHQIAWILAEDELHAEKKQACIANRKLPLPKLGEPSLIHNLSVESP